MSIRWSAILLAAATLAAAPRNDAWRVLGPGGGGAQYNPTISPHNPKQVLINCDMTGAYISNDGGRLWRMFNLRGTVRFFEFDPVDPKTIYAQTIGLWRSTDSGATWRLVFPSASKVRGVIYAGDHAEERLDTDVRETVTALAIDPSDSKTLYASIGSRGASSLRMSKDGGETWSVLRDLQSPARRIYIDPKSPRGNRSLYVAGADSVLVRENGDWKQGEAMPGGSTGRQSPPERAGISAGFENGGGRPRFWAISGNRVLHSEDGGLTWQSAQGDLKAGRFAAVATSLYNPGTAYVSYRGGTFGVAKTTDGGKTWTKVWEETDRKSPEVDQGGWVSDRYGPGWGENPIHLGVAPHNPEICFGTDYGRTLRTADGGKTWQAAYTVNTDKGTFASSGIDVTTCYGIHFDPFDAKRVFISYTDIGLFRSEDGGASWIGPKPSGVPRRWDNTTYWVEFDPEVKGRMWAVMSGTHDLPRPKMWRRASPSTFTGGVLRSDDGGQSWTAATNGIPQTAATHILLDPKSPANARVLYVTGFGKGVYKSGDGGNSWTLKNNGLPGAEPFAWRIAMAPDRTLYLVVARRSDGPAYGNDQDGALYRSKDGAETWERVPLPEGLNGPNGIAIDPKDSSRLYLAAWGRQSTGADVMGGIFLSTDAGKSWSNVLDKDQHVYDVTIDSRTPSTLYASGFESSAWRSVDRGRTWQRVRGYNFKWGHRVIPDPANPKMIYVTTFGGSIWHGPAAGDSSAAEDITTPAAGYGRR